MNIVLYYFALKYKGNWNQIYSALERKERISGPDFEQAEKMYLANKKNIITILDINYPKQLKNAYKPPFVLWCKGDLNVLQKKFICATGNEIKKFVKEKIDKFIPQIIQSYSLVSAAYKGIDDYISQINKKSGTLYILANGFREPYINAIIKDTDLLISEYPPHCNVSKEKLRNRNRLIAAFADTMIIFSSEKNNGIQNLITNFLDMGKDINCFLNEGNEEDGNAKLIQQGANLIVTLNDITQFKNNEIIN